MKPLTSTRTDSGMIKSLWYLCIGSAGGHNRVEIIEMLQDRPRNANEIADDMSVDYNTVRHHLGKLTEHGVVEPGDQNYGKLYFLTSAFSDNRDEFENILSKMEAGEI